MSGENYYKEQTPVVITSAGASLANLTAVLAGVLDMRAGGTANAIENFEGVLELLSRWTTITSITAGVIVADAYLVPAVNGTDFADVDTSSGASYISSNYRVGSFIAHKQLVTVTDYRFATTPFDLFPMKYNAYILNRSGQTMNGTGNWSLTFAGARGQYSS